MASDFENWEAEHGEARGCQGTRHTTRLPGLQNLGSRIDFANGPIYQAWAWRRRLAGGLGTPRRSTPPDLLPPSAPASFSHSRLPVCGSARLVFGKDDEGASHAPAGRPSPTLW